jgi:hypothetical protein
MKIPSKIEKNLRKFEHSLLRVDHENKYKGFYLVMRPLLKWAKPYIEQEGLESYEAESELYILSCDLLDGFNPDKSSLVPYICRQSVWYIKKHVERIKKYTREEFAELVDYDITYEYDSEFYLTVPFILRGERYIVKHLTKGERYIVSKILESDKQSLSQVKLAGILNIERPTLRNLLDNIAGKLR